MVLFKFGIWLNLVFLLKAHFQFVPILFVISTSSMLILDQRTMQIKYRWYFTNIITITIIIIITINIIISKVITIYARVPAGEIFKLSLSPYFDDIAVFHVRGVKVSIIAFSPLLNCISW